jgi:hypothetical protein
VKRALIAILILATGTTVYCAFRNATAKSRQDLATQRTAWQTQTQQITQLRFEQQQLTEHLDDTKQLLAAQPPVPALTQLEEKILSGASLQNLSAAESEQLLAELGFNWNTTGDYIIVSKKSLGGIDYGGIKDVKLTAAAIATLAITPEEQAAIETITRQLYDDRAAWAREHVQRTGPSGDILAQYTLPADTEFSQSQLAIFTNGIFGVLGDQRGQLLKDHSVQWMQDIGLLTGQDFSKAPPEYMATTSLTLKRYQVGDDWQINCTFEHMGGRTTLEISRLQLFPEVFKPLFPGGWKELAEREGFELPKEFNSH